MSDPAHGGSERAGDNPSEREVKLESKPASALGNREVDLESGDNPEERGGKGGEEGGKERAGREESGGGERQGGEEGREAGGGEMGAGGFEPASAPGGEGGVERAGREEGGAEEGAEGGRDYGRFGVGDDEGAAEGGFKGGHVSKSGVGEPTAMGRAAAAAMEEFGGCVERGEVAPPERYPGQGV
ncbi:hypothetical protein Rsub_05113 [Raphidocelis subcapitata]|uniref:Uncharacterized protein n=1 Tax=Raphidocelis subcapitata TaxID=307507 RepID=A0A2V0NYN6_9CHLO|nr:hypothetical protein Rsub_05113 [Raphidocelis subcapitata]|eukprot:GBF92744.1 hypothetical protein Rsub_05113 [Raphidocelis subcapitata]